MVRYLVAIFTGLMLFFLNMILKLDMGGFHYLINYIDGFFIGGFTLVCFSGLSVVSYFGGFDIFSYVSYGKKKYNNCSLYDFSEIQKNRKKSKGANMFFLPYLIIGLLYIGVAAILLAFL